MNKFMLHTTALALLAGNAAAQVAQGGNDPAATTDIRGIRGPVEIPQPAPWEPWALGILGAAILAVAAWWIIRWRSQRNARRVLTARERALAALEQLRHLKDPAASRQYAYMLSDALRHFLEERFALPSTRQTTEEFLATVAREGGGLGRYQATLSDFLHLCDMGKFGKWRLSPIEMDALYHSAVAVINAELDEEDKEEAPPSPAQDAEIPVDHSCTRSRSHLHSPATT